VDRSERRHGIKPVVRHCGVKYARDQTESLILRQQYNIASVRPKSESGRVEYDLMKYVRA